MVAHLRTKPINLPESSKVESDIICKAAYFSPVTLQRLGTPCSCSYIDTDMYTSSCCKSDKHFKTKFLPLPSYKVGYTGLTYSKYIGRINLGKVLTL